MSVVMTFSELEKQWTRPSGYAPLHSPQQSNPCEDLRRHQAITNLTTRLVETGAVDHAEAQQLAMIEVSRNWSSVAVAMSKSSSAYNPPTYEERNALAAKIELLRRIHPEKSYAELAVMAE